jgi:CDP-glycerol glycerophosphotransferase (TagB/SpsB family)
LAQHHSIGQDGLKMGTFNENYKFFLDFAKKHQEYSFVLKPHPALKSACIEKGLMSEKEFDEYIEEWKSLSNANVYQEGNYIDLFKSSDILITDCSSFLAEYFPSKKPIIFINRKDRAPFDDFGKKLSKGFYFVNKADEIEEILQEKDYLKPVREKLARKYFKINGSGKEILNYLQKILNFPL